MAVDVRPAGGSCDALMTAFYRLVFDAHDGLNRCGGENAVYAFAFLAALSFGAFVIIDFMVVTVRRFGLAAKGAGDLGRDSEGLSGWGFVVSTLMIVLCGAAGAWIVAFFAVVVDFVQTAPHTAVATGVLWQVTYGQLLERFGSNGEKAGGDPLPGAPPAQPRSQE